MKLKDVMQNPDLLPMTIQDDNLRLAKVSLSTYKKSAFLDHRMMPRPSEAYRMCLDLLSGHKLLSPFFEKDLIIAHTGFCSSTLFSFQIDSPDKLVLREPQILSYLANIVRIDAEKIDSSDTMIAVLRMLGRRYKENDKTVLKLSNYTNNLVEMLLRDEKKTKLLIIMGSLNELMVSMLLHHIEADSVLDNFIIAMQMDIEDHPKFSVDQLKNMSILKKTCILWSLQLTLINTFAKFNKHFIYKLSARDILKHPEMCVRKVNEIIGVISNNDHIYATINKHKIMNVKTSEERDSRSAQIIREEIIRNSEEERGWAFEWACAHGLYTRDELEFRCENIIEQE